MNKELYTYKCLDCHKTFRTDNPEQTLCSECLQFRRPHKVYRPKRKKKKILTFAEILHIAEIYNKVNGTYLHYGDMVHLIDSNTEHCVCCGVTIPDPEGRQVCAKCERVVK